MKKRDPKNLFGKIDNKDYYIRRNTFFIILTILFFIGFFARRYINLLTYFQYLKLVNLVSIIGLILILAAVHLANKVFETKLRKRDFVWIYIICFTGITLSFLYFKFPYYDKIEHFFFPLIFASIAHYILKHKLNLELKWSLFLTFFIIVGSLSLFELIEYFLDWLLNWRLQGVFIEQAGNYIEVLPRIDDTMIDIGLGVLGTLTYIGCTAFTENRKSKHLKTNKPKN